MTKVNEIVVDAMEDIVVQADEAPIEQSEARTAIRLLNDMMASWDADGISLGYTVVDDMGDVVTVPPGAIMGIKKNLALILAPKYEVTPSPFLLDQAKKGKRSCVNLAVDTGESFFPYNLPQGSGNDYPGYANRTFYPDLQSTVLTETGGSIALEEDTEEAS